MATYPKDSTLEQPQEKRRGTGKPKFTPKIAIKPEE